METYMDKRFFSIFLSVIFVFLSLPLLSAQSNEIIDQLLEQEEASFALSAYMVLSAVGEVPEDAAPGRAIEVLNAQKWDLAPPSPDGVITLGEYSYLLMKAFNMKGGIMYSIFPGPRYAARELAFRNLVRGNSAAGRTISGNEVMRILGRALEQRGENL